MRFRCMPSPAPTEDGLGKCRMLRCASVLVSAAYREYASLLGPGAPCLRSFCEASGGRGQGTASENARMLRCASALVGAAYREYDGRQISIYPCEEAI